MFWGVFSISQKAVSAATTEQTNFVVMTKKLMNQEYLKQYAANNGVPATVELTQQWLDTYRISSLTGINLLNVEFEGSVANFSGGLHSTNGRTTIINGQDQTFGSIINGGIAIENNSMNFDNVNLTSDRLLADQEMNYQTQRVTGNGQISGLATSRQTINRPITVAQVQQAMQTIANYYGNLLPVNEFFNINSVYGHFSKSLIGQPGTRNLGTYNGKNYYIVNYYSNKTANLQTSGFKPNDVLIYNDNSRNPEVTFSGGFTADNGQILWNFAQASRIHNTTKITGRILAPNGILLTNQNVDAANVLQYGAGYSNDVQTIITALDEKEYPVNTIISDDPIGFVQSVLTKDGQFLNQTTDFKKLYVSGAIKITIKNASGTKVYQTLKELPTTLAKDHAYQVIFTLGNASVKTWITITKNENSDNQTDPIGPQEPVDPSNPTQPNHPEHTTNSHEPATPDKIPTTDSAIKNTSAIKANQKQPAKAKTSPQNTNKSNNDRLPQANEQTSKSTKIFGLILITFILGLLMKRSYIHLGH